MADVHGQQPEQHQPGPGTTAEMDPKPQDEMSDYVGRGLLTGKRALITGGDSGIGRAVVVAFAKEGADVAIAYLCEHEDAKHTANLVGAAGRRAVLLPGELADEQHATEIVERTVEELGGLERPRCGIFPRAQPSSTPRRSTACGVTRRSWTTPPPRARCSQGRAAQPDEIAPSYVFFAAE